MELLSLWCLWTLVVHLSDAQEEATVVPLAAGDQNPAMIPPVEIIPPALETSSTDGYYSSTESTTESTTYFPSTESTTASTTESTTTSTTESTTYYPSTESTMHGGVEQTHSPDNHDHEHPDTEDESWDHHPSAVTGPNGMPYTTPMPLYTRGITRKTRWGSNRNTVKRYNNLNPVTTYNNPRKLYNGNSKPGDGDGILKKLEYKEKWNRVGVLKGGD